MRYLLNSDDWSKSGGWGNSVNFRNISIANVLVKLYLSEIIFYGVTPHDLTYNMHVM